MEIAATVFKVGGWASHDSDEAAEHLGNRFTRPGLRHADPNTVDLFQGEGAWSELVVMGIKGQDSQHLAGAQANTAVEKQLRQYLKGPKVQLRVIAPQQQIEPVDYRPTMQWSSDPEEGPVAARRSPTVPDSGTVRLVHTQIEPLPVGRP